MTSRSDQEGGHRDGVGLAVPAAGIGRRMGGARKPFLELAGEPLLVHALRPFLALPEVKAVVVAVAPDEMGALPSWLTEMDSRVRVVPGGSTRLESVGNALDALPGELPVLAVHDAARPLVSPEVIRACIHQARNGVGAVAGWPVVDTLKEVDEEGRIVATPDRSRFWRAQTPQVFPAGILRQAYRRAREAELGATDDAALVAWIGGEVRMVRADPWNLKVTHPQDLALAGTLLSEQASLRDQGGRGVSAEASGSEIRILPADSTSEAVLQAVVDHLEADGVLVHPTETVYGIGGRVTDLCIARVQEIKERDPFRPFLLLLPESDVPGLVWTPEARALAQHFWPGPLTLVLADPEGTFPPGVRSPTGGVAVRVSPHPFLVELARRWPRPLISTSANPSGASPATDLPSLVDSLGHRLGNPDVLVLDGGDLGMSDPSTLVDCTGPAPCILRHGPVTPQQIQDALQGLTPLG